VVSVLILLVLSLNSGAEGLSEYLSSIFWIVTIFIASISTSECFLRETDKGTSHILLLNCDSFDLFLGKLLYSFLTLLVPTFLFLVFSIFLFDILPNNYLSLFLSYFLGILGVSLLSTFMGAVLASLSKGRAIFPVLTIPILIPLLAASSDLMSSSFLPAGVPVNNSENIIVLISFCGVMATLSYLTFDYIREEL